MRTIEQILQIHFDCSVPFRLDGNLTSTGAEACCNLTELLNDLENIGVINNAAESIRRLDKIISERLDKLDRNTGSKCIVLFGEMDAAYYAEDGINGLEEHRDELGGQIVEHEFQTPSEREAYIKGVNDALDWGGAISIGDVDFDRVREIYNSPAGKS